MAPILCFVCSIFVLAAAITDVEQVVEEGYKDMSIRWMKSVRRESLVYNSQEESSHVGSTGSLSEATASHEIKPEQQSVWQNVPRTGESSFLGDTVQAHRQSSMSSLPEQDKKNKSTLHNTEPRIEPESEPEPEIKSSFSIPKPETLTPNMLSMGLGLCFAVMGVYNLLKIPAWFLAPHKKDSFSALVFFRNPNPPILAVTPRWWRCLHCMMGCTCFALIAAACLGYVPWNNFYLPLLSIVLALTTLPFAASLFELDGVPISPTVALRSNVPVIIAVQCGGLVSIFFTAYQADVALGWPAFVFLVVAVSYAPLAEFPVLCGALRSDRSNNDSD